MNSRERFWRAFEHTEPDRVPITELGIDLPHMETITGRRYDGNVVVSTLTLEERGKENQLIELMVECYRKLGFDMILGNVSTPEGWRPKTNPDGTIIDEWGRVLYNDPKCRKWVPGAKTIFKTPEEWEEFGIPDPNAPGRMESLRYMEKLIKEEMVLAARIRDPFALLWEIFTPVKFVEWMYRRPSFIKEAFSKITRYNVELIKLIAETGAELIISGGDWCEKRGPMVPIRFFREVVFPHLKIQVDAAHKRGLKFIKHTDGNITPLLEYLVDIVDGIHSLDPSAGVDIGMVKEKYGERLVLMGNVSVDNLALMSREAIKEETKECIRRASPGGGHILSSSNSWYTNTKLENCLTMVEVGRRYGTYPIRFR